MSEDTKRAFDDIDSSSTKRIRVDGTCLLDLPNEIILQICRYLKSADVLYAFYTPLNADFRLHKIISDYYRKIKFDKTTHNEFYYLGNLLCNLKNPLRPESLILSNEHVISLIERYFSSMNKNQMISILINLKSLTFIDCFSNHFNEFVEQVYFHMTKIEYLHISLRKISDDNKFPVRERCDGTIQQILFVRQICSLHEVIIDMPFGLTLYKSLRANRFLQNIDLVLETIDDLYILLDGHIPNIQKMIIQLRQSRILSRLRPQSSLSCPRLTEFTLLEPGIGFVIDDIKSILGYMKNLVKLTLSIRNTPDLMFSHGPIFESMLIQYLPNLRQFDYTMTHQIIDDVSIEDFILWPMNVGFYENSYSNWLHIYSLPWPSNKHDKRQLPIVENGCNTSVTSEVERAQYIKHVKITKRNELVELNTRFPRASQITIDFSIDIKLPSRISKVILTRKTPIISINSIVQPSVHHLIVECRLNDEREISILARQFPNVEYLKLLLSLNQSSFKRCFQTLLSADESINANRRIWPRLINFSTEFFGNESNIIFDDNEIHRWLIRNTDIKFHSRYFFNFFNSILSIWF